MWLTARLLHQFLVRQVMNLSGISRQADLILVNTCSIRENAEQRVWGRLDLFRSEKRKRPQVVVGVLGCMAERLKEKLLESDKMVDMVVGPDAYRDLPMLVNLSRLRVIRPSMCCCRARRPMQIFHQSAREQRRLCIHFNHARVQQYVRLLRGALYRVPNAAATRRPLCARPGKSLIRDTAR